MNEIWQMLPEQPPMLLNLASQSLIHPSIGAFDFLAESSWLGSGDNEASRHHLGTNGVGVYGYPNIMGDGVGGRVNGTVEYA